MHDQTTGRFEHTVTLLDQSRIIFNFLEKINDNDHIKRLGL